VPEGSPPTVTSAVGASEAFGLSARALIVAVPCWSVVPRNIVPSESLMTISAAVAGDLPQVVQGASPTIGAKGDMGVTLTVRHRAGRVARTTHPDSWLTTSSICGGP